MRQVIERIKKAIASATKSSDRIRRDSRASNDSRPDRRGTRRHSDTDSEQRRVYGRRSSCRDDDADDDDDLRPSCRRFEASSMRVERILGKKIDHRVDLVLQGDFHVAREESVSFTCHRCLTD